MRISHGPPPLAQERPCSRQTTRLVLVPSFGRLAPSPRGDIDWPPASLMWVATGVRTSVSPAPTASTSCPAAAARPDPPAPTGSTPDTHPTHSAPAPPPPWPARTPTGAAPTRMRPPQPRDQHLHLCRHLMRTRPRPMRPIPQPLDPTSLVLPQPVMNRLPRHPEPGRHIGHGLTIGKNRPNRLIPLLSHTDLPHSGECHRSTETLSGISRRPNVTYQPE